MAVCRVVDELNAKAPKRLGVKLACHSGCSACCNQLVCVTLLEWELIRDFLSQADPNRGLRRALDLGVAEYVRFTDGGRRLPANQLQAVRGLLGRPCIFLVQNRCAVYAVRPLVCRTTSSTIRCRSLQQEGAAQMRFDYDMWANNLMMETAARAQGRMAVTPLPHLVYILLKAQLILLRPNH